MQGTSFYVTIFWTVHSLSIYSRKRKCERRECEADAEVWGEVNTYSLPSQGFRFTLASSFLKIVSARSTNE